jgi:hypothetical protein
MTPCVQCDEPTEKTFTYDGVTVAMCGGCKQKVLDVLDGGECPHGKDGKPFGYPTFCCAWPGCPRGTPGTTWVVAGGQAHSWRTWLRNDRHYTREQRIDDDGVSHYSWKEIR